MHFWWALCISTKLNSTTLCFNATFLSIIPLNND